MRLLFLILFGLVAHFSFAQELNDDAKEIKEFDPVEYQRIYTASLRLAGNDHQNFIKLINGFCSSFIYTVDICEKEGAESKPCWIVFQLTEDPTYTKEIEGHVYYDWIAMAKEAQIRIQAIKNTK
ncbi:hypothetical protein [Persicobacter sp. CCB-QB2]|uniref:hypothetical protein n=1 Tax=Persicobacter sp. CCB-QB2 TaxID=1561025 RepID=UPI0006A984B3|nr:hypothetical protein [Persicobacter sp. CCB-QB2]